MSDEQHKDYDPFVPWEVVDRREVFRLDPWIVMTMEDVRLPNGRLVENYCHLDTPRFVIITAFTDDARVIMLRQYRHGFRKVSLTLPGGIMDVEGESTLDCAKRELLEETGYEASDWKAMGTFIPHSNYGCGEGSFFVARGARKVCEPDSGDLEEQLVVLVSEEDALDALRTNKIVSMSNAAALSMALNPKLSTK